MTVCVIKNIAAAIEVRKNYEEDYVGAIVDDPESSQQIRYHMHDSDYFVPARIWGIEMKDLESFKVVVVREHRNVGRSAWASENTKSTT